MAESANDEKQQTGRASGGRVESRRLTAQPRVPIRPARPQPLRARHTGRTAHYRRMNVRSRKKTDFVKQIP